MLKTLFKIVKLFFYFCYRSKYFVQQIERIKTEKWSIEKTTCAIILAGSCAKTRGARIFGLYRGPKFLCWPLCTCQETDWLFSLFCESSGEGVNRQPQWEKPRHKDDRSYLDHECTQETLRLWVPSRKVCGDIGYVLRVPLYKRKWNTRR